MKEVFQSASHIRKQYKEAVSSCLLSYLVTKNSKYFKVDLYKTNRYFWQNEAKGICSTTLYLKAWSKGLVVWVLYSIALAPASVSSINR